MIHLIQSVKFKALFMDSDLEDILNTLDIVENNTKINIFQDFPSKMSIFYSKKLRLKMDAVIIREFFFLF